MKTRFSTTTKKLGNRHRSAVCARKNAVPTRLKPMQLSIGGSGRRGWPQSLGTASTADGTRPMKREERDSRARRLRGPPAPHRPQPPADRSSSMTRRCGSRRSRRDAPPKGFFCFIILASGNRGIIGPSPHLQPMQLARDWSIPFLGLVLVLVGLLLGTVCFLIPSSRLYGPFDPDSFSQSLHSWCVVAPIEWIKKQSFFTVFRVNEVRWWVQILLLIRIHPAKQWTVYVRWHYYDYANEFRENKFWYLPSFTALDSILRVLIEFQWIFVRYWPVLQLWFTGFPWVSIGFQVDTSNEIGWVFFNRVQSIFFLFSERIFHLIGLTVGWLSNDMPDVLCYFMDFSQSETVFFVYGLIDKIMFRVSADLRKRTC